MVYEKKIMKAAELYRLGVPRATINLAIKQKKPFVRRANPLVQNSPIMVDTEEFEKWWTRTSANKQRLAEMQVRL